MSARLQGCALSVLVGSMLACGEISSHAQPPALTCLPANWPTASTTGIPTGTPTLRVIAEDSHTDHDGQVFDAVELQGRLYVDHKNVSIRRSRLVGDIYYAIDGLVGDQGAHLDGVQVMAGSDIIIRHNWIEAVSPPIDGGGVNAAIFFGPDFGEISDVVVDCNMLIEEDGYYPLRIDARGSVTVRSNRWRHGHLGAPVNLTDTTVTLWQDNAYEDGEVIASP